MRRFSQRNSLVTLNDINITPLLDLAFVLLIIFVITTPLLEKGMDLNLPAGVGHEDKKNLTKKNLRMIEVSPQGFYSYELKRMSLDQITESLQRDFKANPNLIVDIRADEEGKYKLVADVLGRCEQLGIVNISLRTDARAHH